MGREWQHLRLSIGRQGIAKQCPERRKLYDVLYDLGETCCPNRVARLARLAGIYAQIGYKRRPGKYGGKRLVVVDNTLARQFDVAAPNTVWVTDITYIKTHEGFSYLAVVIDVFSRRIVGWSMQNRQPTGLVLKALLMAVWRRKPTSKVLVHSDQGSQFTSIDWASFLKHHNLEHSISRRGNCHERDLVRHWFKNNGECRGREHFQPAQTRTHPAKDIQNQRRRKIRCAPISGHCYAIPCRAMGYIEMFYNPKRKHARNGILSQADFERQQHRKLQSV